MRFLIFLALKFYIQAKYNIHGYKPQKSTILKSFLIAVLSIIPLEMSKYTIFSHYITQAHYVITFLLFLIFFQTVRFFFTSPAMNEYTRVKREKEKEEFLNINYYYKYNLKPIPPPEKKLVLQSHHFYQSYDNQKLIQSPEDFLPKEEVAPKKTTPLSEQKYLKFFFKIFYAIKNLVMKILPKKATQKKKKIENNSNNNTQKKEEEKTEETEQKLPDFNIHDKEIQQKIIQYKQVKRLFEQLRLYLQNYEDQIKLAANIEFPLKSTASEIEKSNFENEITQKELLLETNNEINHIEKDFVLNTFGSLEEDLKNLDQQQNYDKKKSTQNKNFHNLKTEPIYQQHEQQLLTQQIIENFQNASDIEAKSQDEQELIQSIVNKLFQLIKKKNCSIKKKSQEKRDLKSKTQKLVKKDRIPYLKKLIPDSAIIIREPGQSVNDCLLKRKTRQDVETKRPIQDEKLQCYKEINKVIKYYMISSSSNSDRNSSPDRLPSIPSSMSPIQNTEKKIQILCTQSESILYDSQEKKKTSKKTTKKTSKKNIQNNKKKSNIVLTSSVNLYPKTSTFNC